MLQAGGRSSTLPGLSLSLCLSATLRPLCYFFHTHTHTHTRGAQYSPLLLSCLAMRCVMSVSCLLSGETERYESQGSGTLAVAPPPPWAPGSGALRASCVVTRHVHSRVIVLRWCHSGSDQSSVCGRVRSGSLYTALTLSSWVSHSDSHTSQHTPDSDTSDVRVYRLGTYISRYRRKNC